MLLAPYYISLSFAIKVIVFKDKPSYAKITEY
jgi:hypothetical protein